MTDPVTAASEYGPPLAGSFNWPRPGGPGSFGVRRSSTHHHQGVDIAVPRGREWLAFADGDVVRVVTSPTPAAGFAGYGRVVVLRHKDRATGREVYALYAHGDSVTVRAGQHVEKGHALGKVGNSQFARRPTRPEGSMGVHLHWELSTHPYPQASEAPTRVDPVAFLRSHGLGGMPPAPPAPPAPVADRAPPVPDDELMAKRELRQELMARLAATDVRVALVQQQLRTAGHPMVTEALGAAWTPARARLWALLVAPSRLADIHAAVNAWLARIDALAARARRYARARR